MTARAYAAVVVPRIVEMIAGQERAIAEAGSAVAAAIASGHRLWVTQTSHTIHFEATHRAGGLMAVHVLQDIATVEAGDVVLVGTSAGTTAGVVDLAISARDLGAVVVALTGVAFETDPRLGSEHPSGRLLHEVADVVVDLGSPYGDGEFDLPDTDVQILPSTGATGVVALWMIVAEAVSLLVASGKRPLVWQSNLLPGAIERNADLSAHYERTRRGYVPADGSE
jgi:uncharacterized phosphosugar-binding protein